MSNYPEKLNDIIDDFSMITDRNERAEYLIEIADRFPEAKVPPTIATKPYDESHRVPACESEAFVWALDNPDGTLKYYFDVLNPQGLSAKVICAVLDETCSGQPLDKVASLRTDVVYDLFGREISMGKGQGLMGIVNMVQYEAKRRLQKA